MAGDTVYGAPTLYNRSVNDLFFDYALSSAYKSQWVYDPSLALANEKDIWEIVRNDAVMKGCFNRCVRAVVRPWKIVPARHSRKKNDRLYADLCWDGISHIDEFDARRRRLADAIFLARTYGVVMWEKKFVSLAETEKMDWWIPVAIKDVDRRRIHNVAEWSRDGKTKTVIQKMFDTNTNAWVPISDEMRGSMIEWVYENTEDRVGYGRGLLEAIYFYHYMKTVTFEKISQGIDRWANGIWKIKLDSLRGASTGKTNASLVTTAKNMLRNMRTEHIAVLGDGDEIEVIETSGSGHQAAMEFLHYLDDEVERLVNGSMRSSGGGSGNQATGARAQAETESDTSESYHQDDRDGLDAVIDRDLLGAFIRNNRVNFEKLGLQDAKRPKFSSEQIARQDPLEAVQIAQGLVNMGFEVAKDEIAEKTNFSVPGPDEETVGSGMDLMSMTELEGDQKEKAPPKPKGAFVASGLPALFSAMEDRIVDKIASRLPASAPVRFEISDGKVTEKKPDNIVVNVSPTPIEVHVPVPVVNVSVPAPDLSTLPAPQVNVTLPSPEVSVTPSKEPKKVVIERDERGNIKGATIG